LRKTRIDGDHARSSSLIRGSHGQGAKELPPMSDSPLSWLASAVGERSLSFGNVSGNVAFLLCVLGLVVVVETIVPMKAIASRRHWLPNLSLTAMLFGMNIVFTAMLMGGILWANQRGFGLLHLIPTNPLVEFVVGVVLLDFMTWAAHKVMHYFDFCWRFHRVHHSADPVDATVAYRQHPLETVLRFSFAYFPTLILGISPLTYAAYRIWSGLQAPLEHANFKLPERLDAVIRWVLVTPNVHKVHHMREEKQIQANFANIFTVWDRLFGSYEDPRNVESLRYGLNGFDAPKDQTLGGLLAMPFRNFGSSEDSARVSPNEEPLAPVALVPNLGSSRDAGSYGSNT
jgi:sterol desaturase/sphingolipid hydroxylase (fatty acid hydroxylase superfamily)